MRRTRSVLLVLALSAAIVDQGSVADASPIGSVTAGEVTHTPSTAVDGGDDEPLIVAVDGPEASAAVAAAIGRAGGYAEVLDQVDSVIIEGSSAMIESIRSIDGVSSIARSRVATRAIDDSVVATGAPALWQDGVVGSGRAVAVIDDGVRSAISPLSGSVLGGACFTDRACGGGASRAVGGSAGEPCAGCSHGTEVASIITSDDAILRGMADRAAIVPIRVFDSATGSASEADIIRGLDHILSIASTVPVDVVNLSLTFEDEYFSSTCDSLFPAMAQAVHRLALAGVITVVASGNGGSATGVEAPACLSDAVAVGALNSAGTGLASFTSRGPQVDILAPGTSIDTFRSDGTRVRVSGTSFAAPHVAGAIALLRQIEPTLRGDQILTLLDGDGRRTAGYPRLSLDPLTADLDLGLLVPSLVALPEATYTLTGDFTAAPGTEFYSYTPGPTIDYLTEISDRGVFAYRELPVTGTYTPLVGDFDRNGHDDLYFYAPGPSLDTMFWSTGSGFTREVISVRGTYRPFVADFDGDGADDVFWYGPGAGADVIWFGAGSRRFTASVQNVQGTYRPVVADIYGRHGGSEIVWWSGGRNAVWSLAGRRVQATVEVTPNATDVAVGDLDDDGVDDVFWLGDGGREDRIWWGAPTTIVSQSISVSGTYTPVAVDLGGDGGDEIVFYSGGAGLDPVWSWPSARQVVADVSDIEASGTVLAVDIGSVGPEDVVVVGEGTVYGSLITSLGMRSLWG